MAEKNHRMCVSCRQLAHKDQLWRVVRIASAADPCKSATSPHHLIQLDEGMGRSAYVCRTERCLNAAQKKKRLSRALRTSVPDEIYAALANRLKEANSKP